jgi:hypothetical protein
MWTVVVVVGAVLSEDGTVALNATDAEPAPLGAATEHRFRDTHVITMHVNTGLSAHLMSFVGWCGSMQQCHTPTDTRSDRRRSDAGFTQPPRGMATNNIIVTATERYWG